MGEGKERGRRKLLPWFTWWIAATRGWDHIQVCTEVVGTQPSELPPAASQGMTWQEAGLGAEQGLGPGMPVEEEGSQSIALTLGQIVTCKPFFFFLMKWHYFMFVHKESSLWACNRRCWERGEEFRKCIMCFHGFLLFVLSSSGPVRFCITPSLFVRHRWARNLGVCRWRVFLM